jgi:xanthine/uracil permease
MLFSLSAGKFGGILAAIPQPIVAAILSITFGMVGEYYNVFQKSSERLFSEHIHSLHLILICNVT